MKKLMLAAVLCLCSMSPAAFAAECALAGKDACARAEGAACDCPARPAVDPGRVDVIKQCVEICCGAAGCPSPTSVKAQRCDCTCSGGIAHEIGGKIFCE